MTISAAYHREIGAMGKRHAGVSIWGIIARNTPKMTEKAAV